MRIRDWWRRGYEWLAEMDRVDAATRITLLILLYMKLVGGDHWAFAAPLKIVAAAGLCLPPLHRSRALWALIVVIMAAKTIVDWAVQDNHMYLLSYWCLAVFLSLMTSRPERAMGLSARLLIGLAFAFAVLWKGLLSPDFMNGRFFHFTLLRDERFHEWTTLVGGMTEQMNRENLEAIRRMGAPVGPVEAAPLRDTPRLIVLAHAMTWWTIVIETAVAAAFLWPGRRGLARLRDVFLLAFAWSTYLVVAVTTFGWLLSGMGVAQCEQRRRLIRTLYLGSVLLVLIFEQAPILAMVNRVLGR